MTGQVKYLPANRLTYRPDNQPTHLLMGVYLSRCNAMVVGISLLLLLFAPAASRAQVLYGSLTGNVNDASNAPIPGAKIGTVNVGTNITAEGVTDTRGVYLINNLQPGVYRVTISAQGFTTIVQENVGVEANTTRRVDVRLEVARVSEKITVSAPIEALQTDRSDVKSELNSTQLTSLPLGNDRNFQSAYVLVAGAAPPFASHSYAGNPTQSLAMYVSGGSDVSNITLIDGSIDTNFWEQNLIAYVPPSEAIEAVNIVTSGFDAEQGNAAGSVTNVTVKSGTNTFHGSAFEFNTSSALQSRNYFYYGPHIPKMVLNQFGVSLGGPIKKNKLFFFGDWERYRLSQFGTGVISIPTQAMIEGNFQGAIAAGQNCATTVTAGCIFDPTTGNADGTGRTPFPNNVIPSTVISQATYNLAQLISPPNYGGASAGDANNFQYAGDLIFHRDSVDLKINYLPSDKSTLFARYSAEPTYVFDPQQLGKAGGSALGSVSQPGNAYGLTQNAAFGGTYTFSPRLLLDANVGYTRPRYSAQNTDIGQNYSSIITGTDGTNPLQGGIPYIEFGGTTAGSNLSTLGNSAVSNPFLFRDNQYTFAANLSWIHGAHNFRFGGDIDRYDMNRFQGQLDFGVRGGFNFTGGVTSLKAGPSTNNYNAWADFLLGLPQSLGKDYVYLNPSTTREWEFAAYARDNWQVTKKLSINYGARWEYYPIPTVSHYGSANFNWTIDTAYLGGVGGVPSNAYLTTGPGQLEPRVGIAYRLTEKTVIRTGYGMSSDPYALNYMAWIYPAVISQQISGASSYIPGGYIGSSTGPTGTWTGPTVPGGLTAGIPSFPFPDLTAGSWTLPSYLGTYGYPNNYHRGYTEAWNFEIQRALPKDFSFQIGYVGDHMVREAEFINFNAGPPGPACPAGQTTLNGVPCGGKNGTPLYAQYGNPSAMTINGPFSGGSYNALETELTRRVARGQIGVVYTYSKTIDNDDTEANTNVTWAYYQVLARNRALAGFDRPHNLEMYAVYNSPFGRGQKWLTTGAAGKVLGDWNVTPVLTRLSGTPFSVTTSGSSCNCPGNTQTADQVEPHVSILGGHGANSPYFDPMAFAPVTAVRFGTTGRNIVRGPGFFNINLSLVRDFTLRENLKLQFRAEAYGLTNTPNFANPATTVSNAKFANGAVTSYGGYDIISGTSASDWSPYATADRQIRFALKLSF